MPDAEPRCFGNMKLPIDDSELRIVEIPTDSWDTFDDGHVPQAGPEMSTVKWPGCSTPQVRHRAQSGLFQFWHDLTPPRVAYNAQIEHADIDQTLFSKKEDTLNEAP